MGVIQQFKLKAKRLKSEVQVLIFAYKDKRTPTLAKFLIGLTAGYLLSPVDLIPDFIPILGLLDDVIIVPLLIQLSIKLIPNEVLDDARKKVFDTSQQLKKTNWTFGIFIISIWMAVMYLLIRQIN